jgi:uncharacterized protein YggU (UPF0235/DUF167 family)
MTACARLEVRLKPRAKADRIGRGPGGLLAVAVTSPPVDERANNHLTRFLSESLGIAKSRITIRTGGHCRDKVVEIEGVTKEEIITYINKNLLAKGI